MYFVCIVPRSLTPVYCYENKQQYLESFYEEYISPGHPLQYWIHPDYLCGSDDFSKFTVIIFYYLYSLLEENF